MKSSVAEVEARLIGHGPATVRVDDFRFERRGNVMDMQERDMPEKLTLENAHISLTFEPRRGTFAVRDKRAGRTWRQLSFADGLVLRSVANSEKRLTLGLLDAASDLDLEVTVALEPDVAEYVVENAPGGGDEAEFPGAIRFPAPFATISLNAITRFVSSATPVVLSAGRRPVNVGAVRSTVVKFHGVGPLMPAKSLLAGSWNAPAAIST